MDLNTMAAEIVSTRTELAAAKTRYDSAEMQSRTHGTENYNHFAGLVKAAFQEYQAAFKAYDKACKAMLDTVGNEKYDAAAAFQPAEDLHGDPSVYYESQEG